MVIETCYGMIEGIKKDGCDCYYGVPFAKPPVGELAFRRPVPPEPWKGILKALEPGANPIQETKHFSEDVYNQDCLYMNIFVPEHDVSEKLPVMVWFFGGSYSHGGTGKSEHIPTKKFRTRRYRYDSAAFATENHVIIVTFNYRLNFYGFLNLHCIDSRFEQNLGIYDQIAALDFVSKTIGAFGGDCGNVTLFGQSAGAACILALMSVPAARGYFHKVIIQSACVEHFFTEEESSYQTRKYLSYAHLSRLARPNVGKSELDKLFAIDPCRVIKANHRLGLLTMLRPETRCAFSPVIDGTLLRDYPKKLCSEYDIPMLIGTTEEEAGIFIRVMPSFLLKFFMKKLGLDISAFKGSVRERCVKAMTKFIYQSPAMEIVASRNASKTFVYRYGLVSPAMRKKGLGATHASDVPVLFGIAGQLADYAGAEKKCEEVGLNMRRWWANFAKFGSPGEDWKPFSDNQYIQKIGF